jgi:hypothetical protein
MSADCSLNEPVRGMSFQDDLPATFESVQHGAMFLFRSLEPIRDVSRRDDQQVPIGHRETVPDREYHFVAKDDSRLVYTAKGAVVKHPQSPVSLGDYE